jgi:hypothetical protein
VKGLTIAVTAAVALAGCGGTKAGAEFRGYSRLDRTTTCVDRWNEWVVTLSGSVNAEASFVEQGVRKNAPVTVVGFEAYDPEKASKFKPTSCTVIIWRSGSYSLGEMFKESSTSPNFSVFSDIRSYPTLPSDEPTDGISDVRFTVSGDGTVTWPSLP